ncbi:LOW QUALITY PROTEIN: immunoglobulin superfamily member 22 [Ciconia maguari]
MVLEGPVSLVGMIRTLAAGKERKSVAKDENFDQDLKIQINPKVCGELCSGAAEEVVSRKSSALLESFSMVTCSFEILAGESIPEFVEKPCPLATPEGDKAIFAEVKSKPKPNATWKRESVPIEEGSRIFDSIFKKYVLRSILSMNDNYKCVVSNTHTDAIYTVSLIMTKALRLLWGRAFLFPVFHEKKNAMKHMGMKCIMCITNVNGKDLGTYSLLVADKKLSVMLRVIQLKPLEVTERQTAVFEICLPKKVQNFIWKFNGKELKWDDKYEIITPDDGLAHTMKIKGVLSIQFISNLKNTQVKKKRKACLECVLTSKDVMKGMNGRVIERSPQYIMKHEGKTAELIVNGAELSDSGDCTAICSVNNHSAQSFLSHASTGISSRDVCNYEEYVCDVHALIGPAELCVVLNNAKVEGIWLNDEQETLIRGFRDSIGDGVCCNAGCFLPQSSCQIMHMKRIWIVKQGAIHKLIIDRMGEEREGRCTLRAKGPESGATVAIGDSLVIEESVLKLFAAHSITVKTKHTASIKVPFKAKPMPKVTWFKDGIQVTEEEKVVMEKASDALLAIKTCVREDSGAIMLNLKNDCGSASDNPYLSFVTAHPADILKPPQGKAEILNTWGRCKMRWKAPKGNGGKQVSHFVIKKRVAGKKSWIKIGVVESNYTTFAMEKVEEGKVYFRIHAIKSEGLIEPLETEQIFAGEPISQLVLMWFHSPTSHQPLRQVCQPQVVDIRKEDVTITCNFPAQDGGSPVQGYIIEKRKKGSNLRGPITKEPVQGTRFKVDGFLEDTDEFCVIAVNHAGPGLLSMPSTSVAKDPIKPPGLLKVVDFSNSSISLAWQEPDQGDVLSGYIPEMAEDTKEWTKCTKTPISSMTYTVGGLQERQILLLNRGVNEAGVGEAAELQEGILAMPPSVSILELHNPSVQHSFVTTSPNRETPKNARETAGSGQTCLVWNSNMQFDLTVRLKSHMVVCAGTAPCIHTSFPPPTNLQLVEEVPNTVTLNHSSDVEDDQTDYGVLKCDVSTTTWFTAAEKVYSNKYAVTGLLLGRKYFFVIGCNDTGDTDPLDSQEQCATFRIQGIYLMGPHDNAKGDNKEFKKQRSAKQTIVTLSSAECFDFKMEYPRKDCACHFIAPLKNHSMSHGINCAFISNPHPTVTLYKGNISITSKSKLWFNSTSSICLLMIPTTCSCELIICGTTDTALGKSVLLLCEMAGLCQHCMKASKNFQDTKRKKIRVPQTGLRLVLASAGRWVAPGQSHTTDGHSSDTKLPATEVQLATYSMLKLSRKQKMSKGTLYLHSKNTQ